MKSDNFFATELGAETARRRTLALISYPDAGKTPLTKKLLPYSGLIRTVARYTGEEGVKWPRRTGWRGNKGKAFRSPLGSCNFNEWGS